MNRLRNRLILVFLLATLVPLGATLWISDSLFRHSLSYAATGELDRLSRSLERTGREYYNQAREQLRSAAASGGIAPSVYAASSRADWPAEVRAFWESGRPGQFELSGEDGSRLDYLVRDGGGVRVYSRTLGIGMDKLSAQFRSARVLVAEARDRDLRRGFTFTLILLAAAVWLVSLVLLIYLALRISRPIQQLTAGLSELASGNLQARVQPVGEDEIGNAVRAFNNMAGQLRQSRERLIYLTRIASWQALARKMAHEVKNSLTPIRLTMEEVAARGETDRAFLEQAAQIVVDEVNSLERRVRAFSQFAAEPPLEPRLLDLNALLEERISFLKNAHPELTYRLRPAPQPAHTMADEDILKGVLTNLLENAAQAAGPGGAVLGAAFVLNGTVGVEVHDSGPGLSPDARASLFEPTISFKKGGMGLGLSIAHKSVLRSGGDIVLVDGELGGAGFRVTLPAAAENGAERQTASGAAAEMPQTMYQGPK